MPSSTCSAKASFVPGHGRTPTDDVLSSTCSANANTLPGNGRIPTDEMEMAAHLYIGIQAFFARHADLRRRPFFITGESYAGKYVPSIGTR